MRATVDMCSHRITTDYTKIRYRGIDRCEECKGFGNLIVLEEYSWRTTKECFWCAGSGREPVFLEMLMRRKLKEYQSVPWWTKLWRRLCLS